MSMIFPGMDPYLEHPQLWPGVPSRLVVYIADHLRPLLRPRYIASIEERVYLEGPEREAIPDVAIRRPRPEPRGRATAVLEADAPVIVRAPILEVHEPYVTILDRASGQRIVTVIEVVSPSNKFAGPGRESYLSKQREVLDSDTHLVEIDLLRAGPHVLAVPQTLARRQGPYDYLICVNRARPPRWDYELYPRRLRDRLPRIRIPLADDDPDIPLDLQAVLAQTYEAGEYRDRLRYDAPCVPPLAPEDQAWAEALLATARQGGGDQARSSE
ncbi:MAG: DUF4058 family protein [Isosphaeraceae bacterium]|nr:DUF4058 family protein [Isosphaeraceae bacterium]